MKMDLMSTNLHNKYQMDYKLFQDKPQVYRFHSCLQQHTCLGKQQASAEN
jgi:hypothetical protein